MPGVVHPIPITKQTIATHSNAFDKRVLHFCGRSLGDKMRSSPRRLARRRASSDPPRSGAAEAIKILEPPVVAALPNGLRLASLEPGNESRHFRHGLLSNHREVAADIRLYRAVPLRRLQARRTLPPP